jgi:hypothetical protein
LVLGQNYKVVDRAVYVDLGSFVPVNPWMQLADYPLADIDPES